ncbi:Ras family, other [Cryptococcus wingfieldii CBS 7118]|uniref:Ras family, other n=1 Tax=Cryptococcus wingfieldii CBS 7118 TaxID=1295528 RepID=A0A1E3K1U0_9TREE|nr:Ras family, other [Cryptococcus wingfieldii CBS 7118]ODO06162.1 Ras family, other [Cryptococcus wingfieldii CBS 7118]
MSGRGFHAREQKLVVVGLGGVGKSSLTMRFVTSQFYDQGYYPTIEDSYRKQVVVDDEAATLEILDTAGQEEYAAMADQWYTFGSGFLLVYSLTDRPTFEEIKNFHEEILRVKDRDHVPCVVVCNKCDLQKYRAVGQLEGRELARSLSAPFIECSAADGVNVDVAFRELVKLVRKDERRISLASQRLLEGPFLSQPQPSSREKERYPNHHSSRDNLKSGSNGYSSGRSRPVSRNGKEGQRRQGGGRGEGEKKGCCVIM